MIFAAQRFQVNTCSRPLNDDGAAFGWAAHSAFTLRVDCVELVPRSALDSDPAAHSLEFA
jgi:hypothetical protein